MAIIGEEIDQELQKDKKGGVLNAKIYLILVFILIYNTMYFLINASHFATYLLLK